jgi:precorrin isomerase
MDTALLTAVRLAREGYGSPDAILAMPTDLVMAMVEHSVFHSEYEATMIELNKGPTP